jgi:hypothetical protein
VADVDGDGQREIAVAAWDGRVTLLDARGRTVSGFPVTTGVDSGERCSPALADLDGDKKLELIFASADGHVYAYDRRGVLLPGWPKDLGTSGSAGPAVQDYTSYRGLEVFAVAGGEVFGLHGNATSISGWPVEVEGAAANMPAVGDLDGDRQPEVVVASEDKVYAFTTSGADAPGWPVTLDGKIVCAPVLADADGDGRTEVLIGTTAGSAYVLDSDGRVAAGWPQTLGSQPITAPAAVGDFDGRGSLSLVFVAGATYLSGAAVGVFDAAGKPRPGYPKHIGRTVATAPLVVDADGDGLPEVLLVTYDGSLLAFEKEGTLSRGFPIKLLGSGITSTPAAADLDDDGFMDIVVAAQNGYLEAITTDSAFEPSANPWPMLGGNHWRTGKYLASSSPRQSFSLSVRTGGINIQWRADERDERLGWAIFKGIKDYVSGNVLYYEMAYVEQQPTSSYSYRDEKVDDGTIYYYKIEERMSSGASRTYGPKAIRAVGGDGATAVKSTITRCYPNPFMNQVSIAFEVSEEDADAATATIAIYDISGKLIRLLMNEKMAAGKYIAEWDGTDAGGSPVASGVYLASLRVGKGTAPSTKTIVLVR